MHFLKLAKIAVLAGLIVAVAAEVGLRYFGVTDFPLYENSRELGYLPLPNQRGSYLGKYRWAFNELSMAVPDPFRPSSFKQNILLIGDSNVLGVLVDQPERLGSVMNTKCPSVWPIAADSWAFLNELRYLHTHEYLLPSLNRIVFVLNFGDFGDASSWSSEISHPTHIPISSVAYIARKLLGASTSPAVTGDNNWRSEFSWLRRQYPGPITIAMYPIRAETVDAKLRSERLDARKSDLGAGLTFIDIYETPNWSVSDYRDDFHLTAEGTRKLALHIVSQIPECH